MNLNSSQVATLQAILDDMDNVKALNEGIKEAFKSLAEDADCKTSELRRVATPALKERQKSGTLSKESNIIDTAQEVV